MTEETALHTRILKLALAVDDARAYWPLRHASPNATPTDAFNSYWFGERSLPAVKVLFTNFKQRFDHYPGALALLGQWGATDPTTRALICHWHLQLSDPLYRHFSADFLTARRNLGSTLTRLEVVDYVADQSGGRWSMAARIQFASRLLSCARHAGLLQNNSDPRRPSLPIVSETAITYLLYLLKELTFEGTLLDNPYARSVGLTPDTLIRRLRNNPSVQLLKQGDLNEFSWRHDSLLDWGLNAQTL
jgi:hypothetical protein